MMTRDFDSLIAQCEADPSLFQPDALRKRMEVLDALDTHFPAPDAEKSLVATEGARILARAHLLRQKLESANALIYHSIRNQIQKGSPPSQLLHWIEQCSGSEEAPPRGLGYDFLDELISGVLQAREPEIAPLHPSPEMVFYQPTPARHILQLLRLSDLSAADTLIDLGSGLGHVPILASALTGARCIGIEAVQAYVTCARECAAALRLNRVTFLHQNAAEANLAGGTVFYLYTPFTGRTLTTVLQNLKKESMERIVTICSFGPCTMTVAMETWLTSNVAPHPDQIAVFRSNA